LKNSQKMKNFWSKEAEYTFNSTNMKKESMTYQMLF